MIYIIPKFENSAIKIVDFKREKVVLFALQNGAQIVRPKYLVLSRIDVSLLAKVQASIWPTVQKEIVEDDRTQNS